jgi:uncharacterized protein (TIGR00730 family)
MRITVYCASSSVVDEIYRRAAQDLGRLIGERGHTLIYGGTNVGLMGVLALAVREAGGGVVGIVPRRMAEHDIVYREADQLIVTETMAERKALMEEHGDGYIALPGGFGTLEELAEVVTLKQLRYLDGPIALVNTAGFYHHLLAHLEHLYETGFAYSVYREIYQTVDTPREALDYVEAYRPSTFPEKWEPPVG